MASEEKRELTMAPIIRHAPVVREERERVVLREQRRVIIHEHCGTVNPRAASVHDTPAERTRGGEFEERKKGTS
jgi:hypothetical protein